MCKPNFSLAPLLALLYSSAAPSLAQQPDSAHRDVVIVTGVYESIPLEEADRPVLSLEVAGKELLSNSLVDFLRLDPSVDLQERAPNGEQTDISIRGGTFGQTLILLDGFRMNDLQSGHHNMDLPLTLGSVSRVEIMPGSGSALYGSDAVGGVINFITQPPQHSEFRLRSAVGNFGVNQESAVFSFASQKTAEQLTFSRDFSSGFRPDRDYRTLALASETHFSSVWGATDLLLAHSDRPFGADQFYGNFNSWERTRTWFGGLRQELGHATEFSFAFRRHTDLFVLLRDHPEVYTNHHALESFQAALRRRASLARNIHLYYGAEGFRDSIASNNLGNHTRGRVATYLALDVRALRRFSLSLGAREEAYRSFQGQLSPTLSAGYWLTSRFKLRASSSRAFRLPTLTDLYYHDPANLGSPFLRPERAWSTEAGLDWYPGAKLQASLTAFDRREQDVIDYVRRSPTDVWRAANIQQIHFRGVEASVGRSFRRSQQLDFRYTGLRGFRAQLSGTESRYTFNYPLHSGVASWQGSLPHGLAARSRIGILKRYGRDPYAVWDLSLAASATRVRPFVQFSNLTNTHYEEIFGIPMPGRAIIAGLEVTVFSRKK
jgi:iron complex outermembrane recepter protein